MNHLRALLAVMLAAWSYHPSALADTTNDDSVSAGLQQDGGATAAVITPGHGGGGGGGFGGGHGGGGGGGFGGGHGGGGFGGGHGPGPGPHPGPGPGPHPGPGPGPHPGPGPGPHPGPGPGPHPGPGPGPHPGPGPGPGPGPHHPFPGPHPGHGPGPHPGPHPGHGWEHPGYWHHPHFHGIGWYPPMWIPAPPPPSSDYLCRGNFVGYFGADRDAYLALDDSSGELHGRLYLESPEATYRVRGVCEQTSDLYANFEFTLVDGGEPYVGTIYEADDGQVYIEGTQDGTNAKFVLRRE